MFRKAIRILILKVKFLLIYRVYHKKCNGFWGEETERSMLFSLLKNM